MIFLSRRNATVQFGRPDGAPILSESDDDPEYVACHGPTTDAQVTVSLSPTPSLSSRHSIRANRHGTTDIQVRIKCSKHSMFAVPC